MSDMERILVCSASVGIEEEFWRDESEIARQYGEDTGEQLDCESFLLDYTGDGDLIVRIADKTYLVTAREV